MASRAADISVLMPDRVGTKAFAPQKYAKAPGGTATEPVRAQRLVSAGWCWRSHDSGAGPLIAAGPIAAALAGTGTGGVVGGITGALVGMGIPQYEAKRSAGMIREGGILLSVHCDDSDWVKRA